MSLTLRARVATAMLELAFNPHQRRDSKGRWTRMPDSELKRPRRARGGKKARRMPLHDRMTAWLSLPNGDVSGEVADQLERMFSIDDPSTGMRTQLIRGFVQQRPGRPPQVSVQLGIYDKDGNRAGTATRVLGTDPETGERWVDHSSFTLNPEARNGGFSSRWLRQMEDRYREAGIDRITISTANVGGYAWAKAGFDFDSAEAAKEQVQTVRERLTARGLLTPALTAQLDDMDRRTLSDEDRPTPMEMAMLGWTPGATTWPGKTAMLNTYWTGVKKL